MSAYGPRPKSRPAASGSAFWGEPVAAATCSAWPLVTHCGSRLCDAAIETLATCARDWATSQKCPFETRGLPPRDDGELKMTEERIPTSAPTSAAAALLADRLGLVPNLAKVFIGHISIFNGSIRR